MVEQKGYRFILPAGDRRVINVSRDTRDAIVAYAKSRDITITDATQRLLSMALRREYIERAFDNE